MSTKLTKSKVDALRPRSQRYSVVDPSLPGFEIRVSPSGVKSASVYYYRNGRQRRLSLGKLGDAFPFAQARADAVAALFAARTGDPAAERAKERGAPTLEAVAARYMAGARARCKPNTVLKFGRLLRLYILPGLGAFRVTDIKPTDVERWHARLHRTPVVANASVRLLRAIMNRAEKLGDRAPGSNPCRDVQRYPEQPRSRVLSQEERASIANVLDEFDAEEAFSSRVAAIRLLSMTAARSSEIVGLSWSMVDLDRGLLRLPDSKTGPRIVPLSRQAHEYLLALHERYGSSPWVCPGHGRRQIVNLRHLWLQVREKAGIPDVKLHDLRRAAASDALEAGVPVAMISGVLGHASIRTTEIYLNPSIDAYQEAAQRMGDRIEQQTKAGSEQLRMRKE